MIDIDILDGDILAANNANATFAVIARRYVQVFDDFVIGADCDSPLMQSGWWDTRHWQAPYYCRNQTLCKWGS